MFLGVFRHNMDKKGRIIIPASFRSYLAGQGGYAMRGFDHNLMVIPASTFEAWSQDVSLTSVTDPDARSLRRLLFSTAGYVQLDKIGRILIPPFLRKAIELEGDVVIVGNGDYFEIWSPERWEAQAAELDNAESTARRFSALSLTSTRRS